MQDAEDLLQELAKDKEAETFYQSLSKTNKFAINFRLQTAKKPETRAKRLREILTNLQLKRM
nr:YdeI/OmpD-associated family protein [Sphingobacterium faecale]